MKEGIRSETKQTRETTSVLHRGQVNSIVTNMERPRQSRWWLPVGLKENTLWRESQTGDVTPLTGSSLLRNPEGSVVMVQCAFFPESKSHPTRWGYSPESWGQNRGQDLKNSCKSPEKLPPTHLTAMFHSKQNEMCRMLYFLFILLYFNQIFCISPQPQWKLTWQRLLPLACPVCWPLPWAGILGYRWLLVKRHAVNSLMGRDSGRKQGTSGKPFENVGLATSMWELKLEMNLLAVALK